MKILLLGEKSCLITDTVIKHGHSFTISCDRITADEVTAYDFIISFGYRYIITPDIVDLFHHKIINLHISLLPYNRGADPNLWSYLEDTPKGVTIHYIDYGLDTGDILLQQEVKDDILSDTLATSYDRLIKEITKLFNANIVDLLHGNLPSYSQQEKINSMININKIVIARGGWSHYLKDKEKYLHLLKDKGFDTPVINLKGYALKRL